MHPFHLLWSVVINSNPLLSILSILVHFIQSYPFFCNFDPLSSIWSISYIFIQVLKSKNHHELCGLRKQLALHWISCVSVQTSESGDEWNLKRIGLCRVWMDLWVSKSSISQWDECSLESSNYINPIESRESSALPLQPRVFKRLWKSSNFIHPILIHWMYWIHWIESRESSALPLQTGVSLSLRHQFSSVSPNIKLRSNEVSLSQRTSRPSWILSRHPSRPSWSPTRRTLSQLRRGWGFKLLGTR